MNSNFERILLIKPSALGDVVHTIPLLVKLRSRFPSARIDWLLTPENAELIRCHPALSNTVLFERQKLSRIGINWRATTDLLRLLAQIRRVKYDLIIDIHGQFRSAFFALVSKAPVRIGFDRPLRNVRWSTGAESGTDRGWMGAREGSWMAYTHRIPLPTLDVHAVDRYLWVGKMLGFRNNAPPDFTLYLPPDASPFIDNLLSLYSLAQKPVALLVPNTIWETKRWHAEGFAAVGRHFHCNGYSVVIAGTKNDFPTCQKITALCPEAINLAGQTPSPAHLAALIGRAAICITNDSGSVHLSVAMDRPVVSVFGPTNPVCIGPYGREEAIIRIRATCSPCNFRKLTQCQHGHLCMKQVTPQMVIERAEKILASA